MKDNVKGGSGPFVPIMVDYSYGFASFEVLISGVPVIPLWGWSLPLRLPTLENPVCSGLWFPAFSHME